MLGWCLYQVSDDSFYDEEIWNKFLFYKIFKDNFLIWDFWNIFNVGEFCKKIVQIKIKGD